MQKCRTLISATILASAGSIFFTAPSFAGQRAAIAAPLAAQAIPSISADSDRWEFSSQRQRQIRSPRPSGTQLKRHINSPRPTKSQRQVGTPRPIGSKRPVSSQKVIGTPRPSRNQRQIGTQRPLVIQRQIGGQKQISGPRRPIGGLSLRRRVSVPRPIGVRPFGGPPRVIVRAPSRIWLRGVPRALIGVSALTGLWIGSSYFWPDSYVTVAGPYCAGYTPDGCVLRWQDVQLEDGEIVSQCVRLCARAEVAPPVPRPAAPLTEPPPSPLAAATTCNVAIFSEPSFRGTSEETTEPEARLDQAGWLNDIASVQVRSGTWDFYTEPEYRGEVLRLTPGEYATLEPNFTKRIGSFMCVHP